MFFTAISLNGVTLSMSPAAVSRALVSKVYFGKALLAAETTKLVCMRANADFLVPTLKVVWSECVCSILGTGAADAIDILAVFGVV